MITNSQPKFLPPIQTNEFLPPISHWTTFGGMFILGVLGLAIPISAFTKYKVTVKSQAVVRPAGELRIVQAATEGQVIQINVKENQLVKKGDIIATIDDSRLQTKKSQLKTNIGQYKLQLVQINAQINALNNQIRAETERMNRIIASAKAELRGHQRIYQDKIITTFSELQEAEANVRIAQEELYAGEAQLQSVLADFLATEAALGVSISKQNRYEKVAQQGALSKNQLEEAQLAVRQQHQAVRSQKAAVEVQKQTIERLKQAVEASIERRKRAQIALNPSNSEVAVATERIAQEKASGEANKATLEKESQALIKQKIGTEKQLERDASELKQIENDLKQTNITATENGIISKLNLRNPNQTLRAGEEVVQIVPNHAPKVIKATIGSQDKGKVKIGQKVQMRVSACPYPDYGTLNGKVTAISPDVIVPQSNNSSSSQTNHKSQNNTAASFYQVTIEPEKLVLGHTKKKCNIQLGMNGRADIVTKEETVLRFFLRQAKLMTDI